MSLRLVLTLGLSLTAARVGAQAPDTVALGVRVSFGRVLPSLHLPPALQPGGRLGQRMPIAIRIERWRAELARRVAAAAARRRVDAWLARLPRPPVDTLPTVAADTLAPGPRPSFAEQFEQYADLGLETNVRIELRSERFKNERCTPVEAQIPFSGCRARFPFPEPDPHLAIRAGGVLGQRFHVNVDYDNQREFSANQNINVFYQGLEDEILERIEVGNVTFEPPRSRFITSGIPANNFGVNATAQLGALHFNGIFAQQKGDIVSDRLFLVGEVASEPVQREARDLDFETGRFFFVSDPASFPEYPDIDILSIEVAGLPAGRRITDVRVYRLRGTTGRVGLDPNLGGIPAVALRTEGDSEQRVGPFTWELLVEGQDYYIDPSSFWFVLRSRLSDEDFLAVSYLLADGGRVGTFPAGSRPGGLPDTLELIHEPRRGPEVPTFRHELRNVYRLGGSSVDRETVQVAVQVNERERPLGGAETYLSLLRVAQPTDPTAFDDFNRLFPRERDPSRGAPIRDLFIVFPHLQPFADSTRLTAAERSDSLYRIPTSLLRQEAPSPVVSLRLAFDQVGVADRSTLSLGGFQIREGSERLLIRGRELVRGTDYDILYETGVVTFTNPDSLFRGPTEVRAQFEQRAVFGSAPSTSILGLATTYDLGSRGTINLIGLFQSERTNLNRPPLGFEPKSSFIGGISADLTFRPARLTQWLDAIPLIDTEVPSSLTLNAELAMSRPNPNQAGAAFIEEFQEGSQFLALAESAWQIGSAPRDITALTGVIGTGVFSLADSNAVALTWQNLVPGSDPSRPLEWLPNDIDPTLRFTGSSQQVEPVLYLTLHSDTVGGLPDANGRHRWLLPPRGGGPRWRSLTQVRSATGTDMSRVEFLEVWLFEPTEGAAARQGLALVFDFGDVLEDATDFSPDTLRLGASGDTTYAGRHRIGLGTLDTERRLNGIWNASLDDTGILGDVLQGTIDASTGAIVDSVFGCETELSSAAVFFAWGDARARCTRRNGFLDTEDLNGDNRLDVSVGATTDNVFRYVLPVGSSAFFVRNGTPGWKLYRIPFQSGAVTVGTPNVRQIRSVRLTVVAPSRALPGEGEETVRVALARLKLVGAPWLKRAEAPIAGLFGALAKAQGQVVASVVGTESRDLGYTSPPGIRDEAERRGSAFQIGQVQINETALRLLARNLEVGDRAEAFRRFTSEGNRNFLTYRELRVWARGRGPGWDAGDLEFFIKAGKDENNFYLYRTPIRTGTWEPEVVVEMNTWLRLRAMVEAAWLRGDPPSGAAECGGDSLAFVACTGPYLVHVRNPGTGPPNLASVQELAAGILRVSDAVFIDQAELWVNDIRLSSVVNTVGMAGAIDIRLTGADVFDVSFQATRRDDQFRQLTEAPSYQTDDAASLNVNVQLDRFLPRSLGISMPFSATFSRSGSDPFFLQRSDILAEGLPGLRTPGASSQQYRWSLRRNRRGRSTFTRAVIDPLSIQASHSRTGATSTYSEADSRSTDVSLEYRDNPGERTIKGVPEFLAQLTDLLPGFVRRMEWISGLRSSRLRVNPSQLRWRSRFTSSTTTRANFRAPISGVAGDDGAAVTTATARWRNEGTLELRPYRSLSLLGSVTSTRDLRNYGDSTTLGVLTGLAGREWLGLNAGFEADRTVITSIGLNPALTSWLRPRMTTTSSFSMRRDANARTPVRLEGDTAGAFALPTSFSNNRRTEIGVTVDWATLARRLFGDASPLARLFGQIIPSDFRRARDRSSVFDRAGVLPSLAFQLGLGGFDSFRQAAGLVANSATEGLVRAATAGTGLPLGLRVNLTYQDQERATLSRRGDGTSLVETTARDWPAGSVAWGWSPTVPLLRRLLLNASGQLRYQKRVSGSEQRQGADQGNVARVRTESETVSPALTLTWLRGVLTALSYARVRSEDEANGNLSRSDQANWNGSVTFSWRLPKSLANLPNAIRTQLRYGSTRIDTCLETADGGACTPISFTERIERSLQLDTDVPPNLSAGLSMAHVVNEERHLDRKTSQLTLTAFVQFSFFAGEFR